MVGVDLIEVERIKEAVARFGERFLGRVFTPGERAYCLEKSDPYPSLAARWAAKEAFMKAVGTGWGKGIQWTDIEVALKDGKPHLVLRGRALEVLGRRRAEVSLSHTRSYAVAVVVVTF